MLNGLFSDLSFRLRALFRPKAVESELDDELHFHFDQQVEKHMRAGLTQKSAKEICDAVLEYALRNDDRLRQIDEPDRIDDKTVFIIKRQ